MLTAACATVAADARGLAGTQWQVTALNGHPTPPSDRFRMGFERARFSVRFGCNSGGGGYRIAGSLIVTGPVMATQMACASATDEQPDPMTFERWGFAVAGQPMRMRWNGAARLTADQRLRFDRPEANSLNYSAAICGGSSLDIRRKKLLITITRQRLDRRDGFDLPRRRLNVEIAKLARSNQ